MLLIKPQCFFISRMWFMFKISLLNINSLYLLGPTCVEEFFSVQRITILSEKLHCWASKGGDSWTPRAAFCVAAKTIPAWPPAHVFLQVASLWWQASLEEGQPETRAPTSTAWRGLWNSVVRVSAWSCLSHTMILWFQENEKTLPPWGREEVREQISGSA